MIKKIKLSSVSEIISGQSPQSCFYNSERNGLPFYQGKKEFSEKYIGLPSTWTTQGTKIAQQNDILMSVRAPVGPVNFATEKCCIGRGLAIIRASKEIDKVFLFYFLINYQKYISGHGGAVFDSINKEEISNIEIPLPAMEEQKEIAARLDAVSDLLAKQKQLLAEQDTLIQSLFYDMFGDLEKQPKFSVKKLSDICQLITDGVHKKPTYTERGIPFISVKDITTGKLCFDQCKFISIEDHNTYCSRCFPEYNDILYTKVGATYGRAAIVDTHKQFSLYVSVALLKPKKEIIDSIFLKNMLNTAFVKNQADRSIKGIGVPDLHLVEIKKFKVIIPPLELQEKFAAIVEQIESEKSKIKSAIAETQTLFNALMAEYFEE